MCQVGRALLFLCRNARHSDGSAKGEADYAEAVRAKCVSTPSGWLLEHTVNMLYAAADTAGVFQKTKDS